MPDFIDRSDWRGVRLVSRDMGSSVRKRRDLQFGGVQYATLTERIVAELLTVMDADFTPNVQFLLDRHPTRPPLIYVPDFVFDRVAWVWEGDGGPRLIHGIECKGRTRRVRDQSKSGHKVRRLEAERHIVLQLVCEDEGLEFREVGRLPLHPLVNRS